VITAEGSKTLGEDDEVEFEIVPGSSARPHAGNVVKVAKQSAI
jgi:cold shock CspA family protein